MQITSRQIATAAIFFSALNCSALRAGGVNPDWSIARQWNEETLQAIMLATPRPTVHARNLYHASVAMYDAWAVYDPIAHGVFHNEKQPAADVDLARRESISFAAYRMLKSRFVTGNGTPANLALIQANLDALFIALGYDPANTSTIGDSPAAVGNRVAASVMSAGMLDGSNQANNYAPPPPFYAPMNPGMVAWMDGTNTLFGNHWTPLAFDFLILGNGELLPIMWQTFSGPHWKIVAPFAIWSNDQSFDGVYFDQDGPPLVGDAAQAQAAADLLARGASLDTLNPATIDISPAVYHNSPLGTYDHQGYGTNPVTGKPYEPNVVLSADYHRALAEYWFDGTSTVTSAGHWFAIANQVSDTPGFSFKWMGDVGPLDRLQWDAKMYLTLGGALHDAAIAAWSSKRKYDSPRPISFLRYMAEQGQASVPGGPSYSIEGLPLIDNLVRIVEPEDVAPGGEFEELPEVFFEPLSGEPIGIDDHIGELVVRAWTGISVANALSTTVVNGPAPGHIYRDDVGWHIGEFELGSDDTAGQLNPNFTLPRSVKLSELRIGQPGRDTDEYIEIVGPPGTSLNGTWLVTIGSFRNVPDQHGRVAIAVDLSGHSISREGVFVIARSTCSLTEPDIEALLENSQSNNSTHALVTNFTGYIGQELDYIDDGVLDVMPWSAVLDCVATRYFASAMSGLYLGAPILGPVLPSTQRQGVEWILATRWLPFQPWGNWVSPPYPGHVSGHSAFARSGAEALADITGSEFFPDGLFTIPFPQDSFKVERGPTADLELQWASYFDAADECGASRLWAGVEPTVSDLAGRLVGAACGPRAIIRANALFAGLSRSPDINGDGVVNVDDLTLLINQWGSPPGPHQVADITGNGAVNVDDLLAVINNWGD